MNLIESNQMESKGIESNRIELNWIIRTPYYNSFSFQFYVSASSNTIIQDWMFKQKRKYLFWECRWKIGKRLRVPDINNFCSFFTRKNNDCASTVSGWVGSFSIPRERPIPSSPAGIHNTTVVVMGRRQKGQDNNWRGIMCHGAHNCEMILYSGRGPIGRNGVESSRRPNYCTPRQEKQVPLPPNHRCCTPYGTTFCWLWLYSACLSLSLLLLLLLFWAVVVVVVVIVFLLIRWRVQVLSLLFDANYHDQQHIVMTVPVFPFLFDAMRCDAIGLPWY